MRKAHRAKIAAMAFCLAAALCFTALRAAPALADDTLVTWKFTKVEELDGKLKVWGVMTNNTDKVVTHIGSRSWQYEQDGEWVEKSSKQPVKLSKALQPGKTGNLTFTLANTSEVSDFTVTIHEVTLEEPEETASRKTADEDFQKVKIRLISAKKDAKHANIIVTAAVYNNSSKNISKLHSKLTQNYDIFIPWESTFTSKFTSFPPNCARVITYKAPIAGTHYKNGLTDAQIEAHVEGKSPAQESKVQLTDIEFTKYTKPELDYGPNKGNVLWTGSAGKIEQGKLILNTTFTNNSKEDIIAINTYSVSFDHDNGRYVSYKSDFTPKTPIRSYDKRNVSVSVTDGVAYRNVRNVKISEISYMSRPVSAKSGPKGSASGSGDSRFAINTTSVTRSSDRQSYIVTVEILNNSSGQRLARIDDLAVHYEADEGGKWVGYKKTIGNKTVNIYPLDMETMKFSFGKKHMKNVRKVKVVGTPRFLDKGL